MKSDSENPGFPQDLLKEPIEARINYFKRKVVIHDHLDAAYKCIRAAMEYPGTSLLVFLCGPTGVGKTTLRGRIERDMIDKLKEELAEDLGRYAVVTTNLAAIDKKSVNWRDVYHRLLIALNEPSPEKKINYNDARFEQGKLSFTSKDTTARMRLAVEQALRQRRLAALVIDDAHVLANMGHSRHLLEQMEILRSLADESQTLLVLLGAYPLLALMELSGQVSRRSKPIHFRRYNYGVPEERDTFLNVLYTFQIHLPLRRQPDLVKKFDYFYERSLGCVGVVKEWLEHALVAALRAGENTLPQAYLDAHAKTDVALSAMLREIMDGEKKFNNPELRLKRLEALGMNTSGTPLVEEISDEKSPSPKRKGRKLVERTPARDPIGQPAKRQKNG